MYHGSRRGGGRAGGRPPPPPPPSQPSTAAARAAATAKALHRRAQERARAKAQGSGREEEPKSDDEQQHQPGGGRRYVIRDHGDPRSDVFRKPKGGSGGRGGGGSILKQLTVGRNQRGHEESNGHGAPEDEPSSAREGDDRDASSRGPPPGPPPGYYPYPPGAYPLPPPGPYGHPPHPHYMYRPYPPPPAGEEGGHNADGEQGPTPGYIPYGAPPPGPHGYPYGAPPPGHYPPGYYPPPHPPPAEARNGPMKKRAAKRPSSLKDEEAPSPPRDEAYSPKPPGSQSRSTRRVIGSHTAIHVPRAPLHDDEGGEGEGDDPLPYKRLKREDSRSVFRTEANGAAPAYGRTASEEREGNASQILLSLSKSFEGGARASPNGKGDGAPMSPHAPPRIQHWHKQATRSDDFEPQPSPPPIKDADPSNIDMKPSFTLFNESFDMNLEGLLGPNASFGLGPMKSLSFGLGLSAGTFDKGEYQQELSKLVSSPTKPERPRGEEGANGSSQNAVMVLTDARRVRSPPAKDHAVKFEDTEDSHGPSGPTKESKRKAGHVPQKIERRLLGAMERHAAVFGLFSYLLPGATAIFAEETASDAAGLPPLAETDAEVARRRVNASLCAFGGVAVSESDAPPEATPYRETLKERYFEEENRLSWEIEEEPPVEASDADDRRPAASTERKRSGEGPSEGPFRTSLQRNMGVMVYPAVNAFTATEPGIITPALNEMNNFVEKGASLPETTPAKAQTEPSMATPSVLPLVSPAPDSVSPAVSPDGKTPLRSVNYAGGAWMSNHQSPRKVSPGQKPGGPPTDLLFVDVQALRPEQYRTVAAQQCKASPSRYVYPALPLPYGQRKRISNAMFAMSTSIPGLTDECAAVLGEARRRDAWDFAVAQLMTQVIVVTHCSVEDSRLDGLSQYLLTLGIAC